MAKKYSVTPGLRFFNTIMIQLLRWGLPLGRIHLLSVRGRKSGKPYRIPVELVEYGGTRWLVSPYGEVNWVKNARAAGEVSLLQRGKRETVKIHELPPAEAAPVLKRYLTGVPITRPYFDVSWEAPLEEFIAEAPRHPVFLILSF